MKCACQSKSKWLTLGVLLSLAVAGTMRVGNVPADLSKTIQWNEGAENPYRVRSVASTDPPPDTPSKKHANS